MSVQHNQTEATINPILQSRILLGQGVEDGFEPPEELEAGILLRGRVHQIFSKAGLGKTFVALWLMARGIERGQRVLYLDMENGPRIASERLRALGVDATRVDDLLTYLSSPSLSLSREDVDNWSDLLDELRPDLVVFDSWVNFLAVAGLDENANIDIARWAVAYTHPARNRGVTVVLLDHVPHEGTRSRGASRKSDEMDVAWKLDNTQWFDRNSVGEIVLKRVKDREGWLPPSVTLSIGGSPEGFVLARSEGTIAPETDDGLTKTQRKALMVLRSNFGTSGAGFNEWQRAVGCSSATLSTAITLFRKRDLVIQSDERYFPVDLGAEGDDDE